MASKSQQPQMSSTELDKTPLSQPLKQMQASGKRPLSREYLYGSKGFLSSPDSLSRLMATHRALRRNVAFKSLAKSTVETTPSEEVDYGYGDDVVPPSEPEPKRRRMQRRNSKTPAMLMAMSASIAAADFHGERKPAKIGADEIKVPKPQSESWDGGLEIAEDLVRHLQSRRARV
eukprot:CAMPEP_0172443754 /NCGR_PEP_ID=MMETSP1065-20121228/3970_1 /TAXON_ID=265537 /ORGANISM="Amphiprora paludosa, Strain CCMP125" /LENGTH=174 /DNA_ID=CAMNT_0013194091 /DNA_START=28 /DNA_END=552 /DNA_ORIENTATION=-